MRKKFLLVPSLALSVLGFGPVHAEIAPTTAAIALPAATVPVRAGAHDDYDRVVFDWPRDVKFQLRRDGNRASITFDAAANMQFSQDVTAHLTRARGFVSHGDDANHITVSFAVDPQAVIKSFTSSTSVVVDITGKAAPASLPPTAPTAATAPAAPPPPPTLVPPATSDAAPMSAVPAMPALSLPEIKPAPAQPAAAPPPASSVAVASSAPQPLLPPAPPIAPVTIKETPAPKTAPAASIPTAAPAPASAPAPAKTTPPAPQTPSPPATAPAAPVAPTAAPVKKATAAPSLPTLSDTPALIATLDPHIAARATIFKRADYGYIIFERKLTLTPEVLANGTALHVDLQAFDMPKNSGYRFPLPRNAELHATLDGTAWKIFVSNPQASVPVTTALVAQPDFALGARFLLPLPDAPEPIRMTDPVVGDTLILVPLAQSEAFNVDRHMADFTIFAAAQGLVIKPLTDKLIVRAVSDGVEITAEGGLQLSRGLDTGAAQQSPTKAKAAAAGKSIFDFATWDGKQSENFTKTRQRLQQTIVDVPETERNRARLELARFYFANGNGEEAVALLNMLAKDVPDLRAHADFIAMLGASNILAYRPDEGLKDLDTPVLSNQPEIELWQAAGLAEQRDWQAAEEKFAVTETILAGYPEPFFSRFFILAIESALATGKEHEAADWLDYLSNAPHPDRIAPAIAYLRGALDAKARRASSAESSWKEAQASNDQLYKVRAELALVDLGVSTGSLTPAQAADRLEALRFAWRGDDLEVDILHRLGQFYVQAKNVKAGLNTLSQAVNLYPSSPLTPQIRTEMATIFHDVFLGDLGKKLSPLDALTLYQQYRTLMPTGKDGDAIMRNLSERLVAIDLLDQSANILEDLARNRLQGDEKNRAALRLAGIRLLDHKPDDALSALDIIGKEPLTTSQDNERTLLRARSLFEQHHEAEANALLKDNNSQGARMLRADIAMHTQEWAVAGKALMELVGPPPTPGKTFTPDQAAWLVNAAIAYALGEDQGSLDKIAIDYSAAMATMPQNDTFRMVTQPEKSGEMRDLSAAQSQISQVDMFQSFLNSYRTTPDSAAAPPKP